MYFFNLKTIFVVVSIMMLLLFARNNDIDGEKHENAEYCRMVALNKKDSSVGWPDFNSNYSELCEKTKSKNSTR